MSSTTITLSTGELGDGRTVQVGGGLPGFPQVARLEIVPVDQFGIFVWATNPDDDEISFLAANPFIYYPDYEVELDDAAEALLRAAPGDDLIVYCLVSVDRTMHTMTTNLLAPLVINVSRDLACQVVLNGDLSLRAPLPVLPRSPFGQPNGATT